MYGRYFVKLSTPSDLCSTDQSWRERIFWCKGSLFYPRACCIITVFKLATTLRITNNKEIFFIFCQIRREAHKCNCHKPFQIVRVAEGKYTFGNSKIIRLVRIHGSSIVVRVGGGWEFLYEFLMRCDPCRGE